MELNIKLDCSVNRAERLKYDVYSFVKIVENYFDLCPDIVEQIEFVLAETWSKTTMFNGLRYENVVLGVMLFAINEFETRIDTGTPPTDITTFVTEMYGIDNVEYNLISIYSVYQTLPDLFLN